MQPAYWPSHVENALRQIGFRHGQKVRANLTRLRLTNQGEILHAYHAAIEVLEQITPGSSTSSPGVSVQFRGISFPRQEGRLAILNCLITWGEQGIIIEGDGSTIIEVS